MPPQPSTLKCWMCGRKVDDPSKAMEVSFREAHFYVGAGCVLDFLSEKAKDQLIVDIWEIRARKIER